MNLDHYKKIVRPLLTEKTHELKDAQNKVAFEVDPRATKIQAKEAIEQIFNVKVAAINSIVMRGKPKRIGRFMGLRKNWKKIYVSLREGHTIDFMADGV